MTRIANEEFPRLRKLAERLVANGPKCGAVSASETHEISEGLLAALDELAALRKPSWTTHAHDSEPVIVEVGKIRIVQVSDGTIYVSGHDATDGFTFTDEAQLGDLEGAIAAFKYERIKRMPPDAHNPVVRHSLIDHSEQLIGCSCGWRLASYDREPGFAGDPEAALAAHVASTRIKPEPDTKG